MKEARPWNAMDPLSSLSSDDDADTSSSEDEQTPHNITKTRNQAAQGKHEMERRKPSIDYEALSRHGYSGGPSVLRVPPPRPNDHVEQDWSWSGGKRKLGSENPQEEESFEERERTRQAVTEGVALSADQGVAEYNYMKKQRRELAIENKSLSFSQKEKRKRELGQASRGKNYVEEEKRLLREQGIYSGFDS